MECETCGRYRPSREIGPVLEGVGTVAMVCTRCRRVIAGAGHRLNRGSRQERGGQRLSVTIA